MNYKTNKPGSVITTAQDIALNSFVALGTTPAGYHLAKDAGGNFVHTADSVDGVGVPGGATTQLQYNNAGAFGGISGATTDGTKVTFITTGIELADNTDTTKKVNFNLSGVGTSTTRTCIAQNLNGTLALLENNLGQFASTTSAQLASVISDETGTDKVVFSTSPTLVTPNLGTPSAIKGINATNMKVEVPQGFMLNGKIVTSVASGTLWISIKTLAGTDPSATDPVYVRIGDTIRTISSAKVVYEGPGQNSLNLGSTELATFETDLFLYLVWNSVDSSVRMFASRMNHGIVISDFIISTTDPRGVILQDNPSWNATDQVEVIGRFNVALSGGAGYTWSIPATSVIINRPIYETRQLTFQPVWTANTTNPAIGNGYLNGSYKLVGTQNIVNIRSGFGSTTTYGTGIYQWSLPFTYAQTNLYQIMSGTGSYFNGTSFPLTPHNNYFFGGGGVSVTTPVAVTSGVMSGTNPAVGLNGNYFGFSWTYNIV